MMVPVVLEPVNWVVPSLRTPCEDVPAARVIVPPFRVNVQVPISRMPRRRR